MTSFVRDRSAGAIPALTAAFTDDFNRADGGLASPSWDLRSGSAVIATNQVQATSSALVAVCTTTVDEEQLVSLAASSGWMVCARIAASGTDRYEFGYLSNRFVIRKMVGGTAVTTVQGTIISAPATPFTIELAAVGIPGRTFLTGRAGGNIQVLMTDASSPLTGTLSGMSCTSTGAKADDFGAYLL